MPVVVTCPSCNARVKVPEAMLGKKAKCPGCAKLMVLQAEEPEDDLEAEEEAPPPPKKKPAAKKPAPPPPEDDEDEADDDGGGNPFGGLDEDDDPPPARKGKGKAKVQEEEDEVEDVDEEEEDERPQKNKKKNVRRKDEDDEEEDEAEDDDEGFSNIRRGAPQKKNAKRARDYDDEDDDDENDAPRGRSRSSKGGSGEWGMAKGALMTCLIGWCVAFLMFGIGLIIIVASPRMAGVGGIMFIIGLLGYLAHMIGTGLAIGSPSPAAKSAAIWTLITSVASIVVWGILWGITMAVIGPGTGFTTIVVMAILSQIIPVMILTLAHYFWFGYLRVLGDHFRARDLSSQAYILQLAFSGTMLLWVIINLASAFAPAAAYGMFLVLPTLAGLAGWYVYLLIRGMGVISQGGSRR